MEGGIIATPAAPPRSADILRCRESRGYLVGVATAPWLCAYPLRLAVCPMTASKYVWLSPRVMRRSQFGEQLYDSRSAPRYTVTRLARGPCTSIDFSVN